MLRHSLLVRSLHTLHLALLAVLTDMKVSISGLLTTSTTALPFDV